MATDVISTIGAAGDYSTLSAWYADILNTIGGDLIGVDIRPIAEVQGEIISEVGTVFLNGGDQVDSTHYFVIRAAAGAEFKGDFGDLNGQAVISLDGTAAPLNQPLSVLQIEDAYTQVQNICLRSTVIAPSIAVGIFNSLGGRPGISVSGCGVTGITAGSITDFAGAAGIFISSGGNPYVADCFVNNVRAATTATSKTALCAGIAGGDAVADPTNVTVLNCTVMNCSVSSLSGDATVLGYVGGIVKVDRVLVDCRAYIGAARILGELVGVGEVCDLFSLVAHLAEWVGDRVKGGGF